MSGKSRQPPMPANRYRNPLTDILFEKSKEFMGLYHVGQGWFTHVNTAGYQLLGYSSAQALYDDPARTLRARHLTPAEWDELRERVLRDGYYAVEMELRRQSGDTFWAHVELTCLWVEEQAYFVVHLTDTTPLHVAEHRLAESMGRFEAVVSHATIGIVMCNRAGDIVLANDKARQLFGYPDNTLLHQRIEALVPAAIGRYHEQLRESFHARPAMRAMGHNRDLLARRHDGSEFPVEVSLSYFQLDGELFVVAYIIDITAKKEAEQELHAQHRRVAQLNAELEQKVADRTQALGATLNQLEQRTRELSQALAAEQELGELKTRFVSMASHEFRTPLTAVLTSVMLLEKYTETEQQAQRQRHLNRIRTSVKHLTDILEEFLSVGRLEDGRLPLNRAELALAPLVHEAVAEVTGLRKPGQRIELALAPGLPPLWQDASLLRKVLANLLSNALKYSAENTTVAVRATLEDQWLRLTVQDQGIGIAPDDQERLFQRFFRARNAANLPGTGLGLYIVARYVELLGGTVALRSELGAGTTVTITLPYEKHSAD
ncbi:PAS domain S-box protein [Hymenobacter sp. DH14]|uniref:histidine kinase n=1 Tax=Hymenobacter cyanobacteriorum TaxID=2926463 RepID=A0A9X1VGS6_9BACT|nr:PAS domain-containing sensor histidine kinase [Hymenobacter cyanobacteriorum]MCI1188641.1 PAS domain S-box protein [Hymenobacter cyanobacteriorum]